MGPRRTTLSFSSEDAPQVDNAHKIYVYYCKYSGRHALTTDCNLATAPRRRTDHALVLDTQRHTVKLYTTDGGAKFLKRRSGAVEKQYRVNVGKLPIAYRTEPEGRYLYILDDALTASMLDESTVAGEGKPPVPPCITRTPQGARVAIDIEDRGPRNAILKVSGDAVRVQIKRSVQSSGAAEELLDYMRNILGVKLSAMALERGETPRQKILVVDGLDPDTVFDKYQKMLKKPKARHT